MSLPPPLWMLDFDVPWKTRAMAFRLLRVRIRKTWMKVDPFMVLTFVAIMVLLRIAYRSTGLEVSVANLLAGEAMMFLALIAGLGALTKRNDRREGRVAERGLRMHGYRLTRPGRLEPLIGQR
ncbi:MAG: hypothetical protein AAF677_01540 [Pseudomonadota bacterium]